MFEPIRWERHLVAMATPQSTARLLTTNERTRFVQIKSQFVFNVLSLIANKTQSLVLWFRPPMTTDSSLPMVLSASRVERLSLIGPDEWLHWVLSIETIDELFNSYRPLVVHFFSYCLPQPMLTLQVLWPEVSKEKRQKSIEEPKSRRIGWPISGDHYSMTESRRPQQSSDCGLNWLALNSVKI